MQTDELGKFIRELMPKPSADERIVAREIYKGLAASGTISVSMLLPEVDDWRQDVVSSFCHFVHFFKDDEAARKWAATRPGTRVITLDQGLELGRIKNEWQFGEGL
jgi:hypothetical protein